MDFFESVFRILVEQERPRKFQLFRDFYEEWKSGHLDPNRADHQSQIHELREPSYSKTVRVVNPGEVPRRNRLDTDEGRARMIHAITHIEYSAVDLALDHTYRFRKLPPEFYEDWIEVAREEIEHFEMLAGLLEKLGFQYGGFPVHSSLFEAAVKTPRLRERMAVVPRHLEAGGLDANPRVVRRLSVKDDAISRDALKAMGVILRDEIDHVKKGDRWFRHACQRDGVGVDTFQETVESVFPGAYRNRGGALNVEARRQAGFSEEELMLMQRFR